MNKKTAIIIGVIILILSSIITPFLIRKIKDRTSNSDIPKIEEKKDLDEDPNLIDKVEIIEQEKSEEIMSGEIINSNDEQTGSGDIEKEKTKEVEVTQKGNTKFENTTTASSSTSNKTQPAKNEKENIYENVANVTVETNKVTVIDVATNEAQSNEVKEEVAGDSIVNADVNVAINTDTNVEVIENVNIPVGAVGVLKIDKIGLNQKVNPGHSLEVLKTALGHVDETAYSVGNIGILGHNSGNAGYFQRLTELVVDDVIEYTSEEGTRKYKVSEITQIADDDWSKLSNTKDNRITLITCVKNVPEKRLCVQGVEI